MKLEQLRVFYHPSFDDPRQKKLILGDMPGFDLYNKDIKKVRRLAQKNTSAEMRPCYESPLLTFEQEHHLFRKMNYFKYWAKKYHSLKETPKIKSKVESLLKSAEKIRNQIAEANFRLATQLLKAQIGFYRERSLVDSLLSDAYYDVLKSVDYFNWTLGHRFSTYTTWVLRKNFYRDSKQKLADADKFQTLDETDTESFTTFSHQEDIDCSDKQELVKYFLKLLAESDGASDKKRQVRVLENYFGLNGQERKTLEEISYDLGVTKERVRQLKEQGLDWIKEKAEELDLSADNFF